MMPTSAGASPAASRRCTCAMAACASPWLHLQEGHTTSGRKHKGFAAHTYTHLRAQQNCHRRFYPPVPTKSHAKAYVVSSSSVHTLAAVRRHTCCLHPPLVARQSCSLPCQSAAVWAARRLPGCCCMLAGQPGCGQQLTREPLVNPEWGGGGMKYPRNTHEACLLARCNVQPGTAPCAQGLTTVLNPTSRLCCMPTTPQVTIHQTIII